ncbi:hypothetical protein AB0B97_29835 [Micromonospora sp. NPDC049004]
MTDELMQVARRLADAAPPIDPATRARLRALLTITTKRHQGDAA